MTPDKAVITDVTQFELREHSKHLDKLDSSIGELTKDIHGLRDDLGNPPNNIQPLTAAVTTLTKGFTLIEKREEARVREAHEDRRALRIAIYSFVTAIIASGVGALLVNFV